MFSRIKSKDKASKLREKLNSIPKKLSKEKVSLSEDKNSIFFEVSNSDNKMSISNTLKIIAETGLSIKDIHTSESSLEDIFLEIIADEERH